MKTGGAEQFCGPLAGGVYLAPDLFFSRIS